MLQWIKNAIIYANKKGLPIPFAQYNGTASVSLSLLVISATFVILALLSNELGIKVSFWETLAWFSTCAVLYFNRSAKISKDGFELSSSNDKEEDGKKRLDTGRKAGDDKGTV